MKSYTQKVVLILIISINHLVQKCLKLSKAAQLKNKFMLPWIEIYHSKTTIKKQWNKLWEEQWYDQLKIFTNHKNVNPSSI